MSQTIPQSLLTPERAEYLLTIHQISLDSPLGYATPSRVASTLNKNINTVRNMMLKMYHLGLLKKGGHGMYKLSDIAKQLLKNADLL
ncbi:MAG: hypothetical protein DRP01_01560 [Archaeoglobales archaeon]|nr:MAG: hypothetical protein DRP01_01560 [Archaeoglobales archaeon]